MNSNKTILRVVGVQFQTTTSTANYATLCHPQSLHTSCPEAVRWMTHEWLTLFIALVLLNLATYLFFVGRFRLTSLQGMNRSFGHLLFPEHCHNLFLVCAYRAMLTGTDPSPAIKVPGCRRSPFNDDHSRILYGMICSTMGPLCHRLRRGV